MKIFSPIKTVMGEASTGPKYSVLAFYKAYGAEFFSSFLTENLIKVSQKRTLLSAYNHSLTLSLIRDLKLNVPLNYGLLRIAESTPHEHALRQYMEVHHKMIPNYDGVMLEQGDVGRLLPTLQNKALDIYGGAYEPSTAVLSPAVLTRELARVAAADGVEFQYGTEVYGLRVAPDGDRVDAVQTSRGDLSADAVVLAAGYSTYSLTDSLVPAGALAPLIPVRNLALTIKDTTPVPASQPLPPVFASKPLVLLPTTPSDKKDGIEYFPVAEQILSASEGASMAAPPCPAAVDFPRNGTLITADHSNPRIYHVFAGAYTS
jgi:hypothetical protein